MFAAVAFSDSVNRGGESKHSVGHNGRNYENKT